MPFPIDEIFITKAEETLGLKFPATFKAKMQNENGGEIEAKSEEWTLYPIFDSSDKKRTKRTANHIIYETNQAKTWAGFPESAIAIASNGCGDQLVFIPSENNPSLLDESIYFWDHETRELLKIANNINEL